MSLDPIPDDVVEEIGWSVLEMNRLSRLSNEDLCKEFIRLRSDQDNELITNEMLDRLWPEWKDADL